MTTKWVIVSLNRTPRNCSAPEDARGREWVGLAQKWPIATRLFCGGRIVRRRRLRSARLTTSQVPVWRGRSEVRELGIAVDDPPANHCEYAVARNIRCLSELPKRHAFSAACPDCLKEALLRSERSLFFVSLPPSGFVQGEGSEQVCRPACFPIPLYGRAGWMFPAGSEGGCQNVVG